MPLFSAFHVLLYFKRFSIAKCFFSRTALFEPLDCSASNALFQTLYFKRSISNASLQTLRFNPRPPAPLEESAVNEFSPKPMPENAVEVPHSELDPTTLRNLAEEFVTRDGTDYGEVERSLEAKVEALMRLLESGEARIYYESESQTVQIVAPKSLGKPSRQPE